MLKKIAMLLTVLLYGLSTKNLVIAQNDTNNLYVVLTDNSSTYIYQSDLYTNESALLFELSKITDESAQAILPESESSVVSQFLLDTQGYMLNNGLTEEDILKPLTLPLQASIETIEVSPDQKTLAIVVRNQNCLLSLNYCYGISKIITIDIASKAIKEIFIIPFHNDDPIYSPTGCNFYSLSAFDLMVVNRVKWSLDGKTLFFSTSGNASCFNLTGQNPPIFALSESGNTTLLGYGIFWNVTSANQIAITTRVSEEGIYTDKLSIIEFNSSQVLSEQTYELETNYRISEGLEIGNSTFASITFDQFNNIYGVTFFSEDSVFKEFPADWNMLINDLSLYPSFKGSAITSSGQIIAFDKNFSLYKISLMKDNFQRTKLWEKPVSTFFLDSAENLWITSDSQVYTLIDLNGQVIEEFDLNNLGQHIEGFNQMEFQFIFH